MKTVEEIQKKIDELYYWDMDMIQLSCEYLVDEIKLTYLYNDKEAITYHFRGCYESSFKHCLAYKKGMPAKDWTYPQNPYFMQSVEVEEFEVEDNITVTSKPGPRKRYRYLRFKIDAYPMDIEIVCEDIEFSREKYDREKEMRDTGLWK